MLAELCSAVLRALWLCSSHVLACESAQWGELDEHEIRAGEQGQKLILICWEIKQTGHCLEYSLSPSVHCEEHPLRGVLN